MSDNNFKDKFLSAMDVLERPPQESEGEYGRLQRAIGLCTSLTWKRVVAQAHAREAVLLMCNIPKCHEVFDFGTLPDMLVGEHGLVSWVF